MSNEHIKFNSEQLELITKAVQLFKDLTEQTIQDYESHQVNDHAIPELKGELEMSEQVLTLLLDC